jgi:hypothetical protein
MLSSKSSRYPNTFPNSRHRFCIRIREHLNLYLYLSKNVVKSVIWIQFHAYPIRFHPYARGVRARRRSSVELSATRGAAWCRSSPVLYDVKLASGASSCFPDTGACWCSRARRSWRCLRAAPAASGRRAGDDDDEEIRRAVWFVVYVASVCPTCFRCLTRMS